MNWVLSGGHEVASVVIVSDGGENVGSFVRSLQAYERGFGYVPRLVMLKVPGDADCLSSRVTDFGFRLEKLETDGSDYYVYDQVMALLGGPPAKSLVERILETEMPKRNWGGG